MKHLFLIHSHTSFLSSIGTINCEQINADDVVFFVDKTYNHNELKNYEFHNIEFLSSLFSPISVSKILRLKKSINKVDVFIGDRLQGEKYVAYVPQTMHPFYQIMGSNKQCIGYHIIEEGIGNYNEKLYQAPRYKLSVHQRFVKYLIDTVQNRFVINNLFFAPCGNKNFISKYYYLFNDNLPFDVNIKAITWIKSHAEMPFFESVFICSPLIEYNLVNSSSFYKTIDKIAKDYNNKSFNELAVKFHPNQSSEVKEVVINIFNKENISIKEIGNEISMEQLFASNKVNNVYGIDSSLLFYASLTLNHDNIYAASSYLRKNDALYKSKASLTETMEKTLFKKVKQL